MGLNFKVIRNGFFLNLKIGFLFVINNLHLSMSHLVWRKLIWMYRCIQGDVILIKYRVCSILIHMALLGVVLKEDDALVTVNTSINADLTSFWCFSKTVLSFNTYSIFTLLTSEEKKFNINVNLLECPLIVYVLFKKKRYYHLPLKWPYMIDEMERLLSFFLYFVIKCNYICTEICPLL